MEYCLILELIVAEISNLICFTYFSLLLIWHGAPVLSSDYGSFVALISLSDHHGTNPCDNLVESLCIIFLIQPYVEGTMR